MKAFLGAILALCVVSCAYAELIEDKADDYSDGTDISGVSAGMTLSAVGGASGLDGKVYAQVSTLASTPNNVFANSTTIGKGWYADLVNGVALKAEFDEPAKSVWIDIIADDAGDRGILYAYDSSDILLDSVLSPESVPQGYCYSSGISRPSYEIAYIIAGGSSAHGDVVCLDKLRAEVPEPATIVILWLGSLLVVRRPGTKGK